MSKNVQIPKLVSLLIDLSQQTQHIIKYVLKENSLNTLDKNSGIDQQGNYIKDQQTLADITIESLILNTIRKDYNDIKIIAEEETESPQDKVNYEQLNYKPNYNMLSEADINNWPNELLNIDNNRIILYIDPLDGTREFTDGYYQNVTTLIGISVDKIPMIGIIGQPFYAEGYPHNKLFDMSINYTNRVIYGVVGLGVRGIQIKNKLINRIILTMEKNQPSPLDKQLLDIIKPDEVLCIGGTGSNLLYMLDNISNYYIQPRAGTKRWDTCAGEAIFRSINYVLKDCYNRQQIYDGSEHENLCGFLACENIKLFNNIYDKIKNLFELI